MAVALHRVFVYGTLKRSQPNHHLLQDTGKAVKFLGTARLTKPHPLILTKCGIPMLLAKEGAGKIVEGELYEVNDVILEKLDDLEDHPSLYTRTPTHCHNLTPPTTTTSPTPTVDQSKTPPPTELACETYMVFDFTDAALQLPHYTSFDAHNLPDGVKTLPPAKDRTPEINDAIYKSLWSIKNEFK